MGPNGAGKTTLLQLAVGLLEPTVGTVEVLGGRPSSGSAQLARVGFVAQDTPTYAGLSVAQHLRMGAWLNPGWDLELAQKRVERLGLDPRQRAGSLSGGQRAQLALTVAIAKRPGLLLLDEPVASLDPLARREFLGDLMEVVAAQAVSVVLSSHLVADLERVCDHLIVLAGGSVQLAGDVADLLAGHHRLAGPRRDLRSLPAGHQVIEESHTDKQTTLLVRTERAHFGPRLDGPAGQFGRSGPGLHGPRSCRLISSPGRSGGVEVIRLAWVQARVQTLIVSGLLAAMAIALAISGPHLAHLYDTTISGCSNRGDCPIALTEYLKNDSTLRNWLDILVVAGPGILGIFWGAPMVARELEAGTFRLAWTQSVTRTRWLAVKLGVVCLASMAVAGLLSLIVGWWASPLDRARADVFSTFDQRDIVPVGFALFGCVLGVTAGVIIRRTLPAMAATLVAFVGARLGVTKWVRPHLLSPLSQAGPITAASVVGYGSNSPGGASTLQLAPPTIPNAWIYSTRLVDQSGRGITAAYLQTACPTVVNGPAAGGSPPGQLGFGSSAHHTQAPVGAQEALQQCGAKIAAGFHEVVTYQPGSRYWELQWLELGVYIGAALVLTGLCIWWVRRRLA